MDEIKASRRIQILLDNFYEDYEAQRDLKERDRIYKNVFDNNKDASAHRRFALGLDAFLKSKKILLREYDLLAGNVEYYDYTSTLPIPVRFIDPYLNTLYDSDDPPMQWGVQTEIERYREIKGDSASNADYDTLRRYLRARNCFVYARWASGHVIAGYDNLIANGLEANIRKAEKLLETETDPEKAECLEDMIITNRSMQHYLIRYAREAEKLAEESDSDEYRRTLKRISNACRNLSTKPASTFFEALQMYILIHDVIVCENMSGSISLGRVDQVLYPYYKRDLEKGTIDPDEAQELINALWLKFGRMIGAYQNVTLGGCDREGGFAGNDITIFCLRASYTIRMEMPLLSFRYHGDMPDLFWSEIVRLIRTGIGFPALFNDDIIFKAKARVGIDESDLWNYGIVGCVEPCICGQEYSHTEEMRLSWAKILELMLSGGVCTFSGLKMDMAEEHDFDSIRTFDEFFSWYRNELKYFTQLVVDGTNLLDETYGDSWPAPFLSSTFESSVEKRLDVTKGGAKYSNSSVDCVGMADTVDSLLAIKKVVFEERAVSLKDLAAAVKNNYSGYELLRLKLSNISGRFGNDDKESNDLMNELADTFIGILDEAKNNYGQHFQAGFYSVNYHAILGENTGALPDGRLSGISLANGFSPCQGADTNGPTAMINSVFCEDHSRFSNGMVMDIKFTPQYLNSEVHQRGMIDMIKGYFSQGGQEIQINVVSRETLIDAQKHPENYKNLIVRVSGYSAYFNYLPKTLQDEIIARTEIA